MLHAAHAAYKTILIRTVDTDVVLAMALAGALKEEIEVWVSISTGKSFRISAGHEIARALGPEKAQGQPMALVLLCLPLPFVTWAFTLIRTYL